MRIDLKKWTKVPKTWTKKKIFEKYFDFLTYVNYQAKKKLYICSIIINILTPLKKYIPLINTPYTRSPCVLRVFLCLVFNKKLNLMYYENLR